MDIFLFNRKLMWAVVPLVFWSIFVLFGALDAGKDEAGSGLSVKLERRGVRLPGRLISIVENEQGELRVEMGVLREEDGHALAANGSRLETLPEGLEISYTVEEPGRNRTPPQISLQSGENRPLEFLQGRMRVLISDDFIIRMGRQGVQVLPKGQDFDQRKFVQELLRRREGPFQQQDGRGGPPRDGMGPGRGSEMQERKGPGDGNGQDRRGVPPGDGNGRRPPPDGDGANRPQPPGDGAGRPQPPPGGDGNGRRPPPDGDGNGRKLPPPGDGQGSGPGKGGSRPRPPPPSADR